MKDPYLYKSCTPLVISKTQQSEFTPKRTPGMKNRMRVKAGNNEFVNTVVASADAALDKTAQDRNQSHLALRRTNSYRLARAAAKRNKRNPFKKGHED